MVGGIVYEFDIVLFEFVSMKRVSYIDNFSVVCGSVLIIFCWIGVSYGIVISIIYGFKFVGYNYWF